jgi:hypothetical protein
MSTTALAPQERWEWTSASNAQADSLCMGRHQAQKGIPDTTSSDAAFGNAIHLALATGKTEGLTAQQEDIYESFLKIEKKLLVQFFGPEVEGITPKPVCEKRYWAKWPDGLQHSGQLDRVHRKGSKALIIECKSLVGEIPESPKNMQLRDQAALFDIGNALLTEVGVAVIQPLATHSPELCIYNREHLMRAREELYKRVAASNKPDAPRTAGAVQCKFCKAKSKCSEYQTWAGGQLPVQKSLVDVPIASWTPDQRKQFCDNFDVAQKWLNNAWDEMEKLAAADPNAVPGYAMAKCSPREKIVNLQAVFDRASKHSVPLELFLNKSTISKTDLTEITRLHSKLKGKGLKDAVEGIIGDDVKVSDVKSSLKKVNV